MELTRRDALAALAGSGIVVGGAAAALTRNSLSESDNDAAHSNTDLVDALVATAHVIYPSAVANVEPFVETFAVGRIENRHSYRDGALTTLSSLDDHAQLAFEKPYLHLDATEREVTLERVGARTAEPDPDGTTAERVRYYFVNEVLYALFTSPKGGRLVGIENPQGHPGGTESYQHGPNGGSP